MRRKTKKHTKKYLLIISLVIYVLAAYFFLNKTFFQEKFPKNTLVIINPHENPEIGGEWTVRFKTQGEKAPLIIIPDPVTTKIDEKISFESLRCGKEKITASAKRNAIKAENWNCGEEANATFRVKSSGVHKIFFFYGAASAIGKNFTCDSGTLDTTCTVSTTQTVTGETITGTGNLIIANAGTLTTSTANSFTINMGGDVTIQSGGTITGNVSITAANVDIQSGGSININGKGNLGGQTSGANGSGTGGGIGNAGAGGDGGGGGYGGNGGNAKNGGTGGATYGSITSITFPTYGSGGGAGASSSTGGAGGGSVKITATSQLTITGNITANGGNGTLVSTYGGGGGSGGSINITAGTLTGSGTITTLGGNGGTAEGGGGAGGRIAIVYTTLSSFTSTVSIYGGTGYQAGGSGTYFIKAASATNGDFACDNNSQSGAETRQVTYSYTFDNITIKNGCVFVVPNTLSLTSVASTFGTSSSAASLKIESGGTFTGPSSFSIPQYITFNIQSGSTINSISALTIAANATLNFDNFTAAGSAFSGIGTINLDGTMTHTANTSGSPDNHVIKLSVTTLTIGATGAININGKGGPGGGTSGANGSGTGGGIGNAGAGGDGGGGGYGGNGGNAKNGGTGGATYGGTNNITNPTTNGSGGGAGASSSTGGAGAGAVILSVSGTLTITGNITANGGNGTLVSTYGGGGGSGGSINITAGTLTGSGTITTLGGNGGTAEGGGGGGGRIAIVYTTLSSFSSTPRAYGGTGNQAGGAGTYGIKAASATNGDLTCDNNGLLGATTKQVTSNFTFDNISISNGCAYVVTSGLSLTITASTLGTTSIDPASLKIENGGTFTGPSSFSIPQYITFNIQSGSTINSISALTIAANATLNFDNFTAAGSAFSGIGTINLDGTMTHTANTSGSPDNHVIKLSVTTLTISATGSINVNSKGGPGGGTSGANGSGTGGGIGNAGAGGDGGGGGYGGNGGNAKNGGTGGATYGGTNNITNPTTNGSGGGAGASSSTGGAGAGAVILSVSGTLTITGNITANGGNGTLVSTYGGGGGSGGSINITAGTLTGSGTITTLGGNGGTAEGGGGAGGRIAIVYTTLSSFSSTPRAYGGTGNQAGGAGTYGIKAASATNGDLSVENNSQSGANTTQVSSNFTFDNITIKDGTAYVVPNTLGLTCSCGSNSLGYSSSSASLKIESGGSFTGISSFTIPANITFNIQSGSTINSISALTIAANATLNFDNFTAAGSAFSGIGTINLDGTMTHTANTSGSPDNHVIKLSVTTLTIGATGAININGKGGPGGGTAGANGSGTGGGIGNAGVSGDGGGGGYGSAGGNARNGGTAGSTYGSSTNPTNNGSGGGAGGSSPVSAGGAGAGAVILSVSGTLSVTGGISANGGNGTLTSSIYGGGGGSGGSVNITATTISGNGSIFAKGGNGASTEGGCGGGGRVFLAYSSNSITPNVDGGSGFTSCSAGTIETQIQNQAPTAPTTLYSNNTTAQAGKTNPIALNDTTPAFSAICNDPDGGDILNKARIQVSTDQTFSSITHWDSGASGTSITNCTAGNRSADIVYGSFGTAPTQNLSTNDGAVTYYWRIKFWDDSNTEGSFSTVTARFTMLDGCDGSDCTTAILQVVEGNLNFRVDSAIIFDAVTTSASGTEANNNKKPFTKLIIDDIDNVQGFCLQLNSTNLIGQTIPSLTIPLENLKFIIDSIGISGNVTIPPTNYASSNVPLSNISQNILNSTAGANETGTYDMSDRSTLKLGIPAFQPPDTYRSTLTFTLSTSPCI